MTDTVVNTSTSMDVVDTTKAKREALLRKTYTEATKVLRNKYKDEFLAIQQEIAQNLGLDWTPRLSKAAKARQQVEQLLAENPELKAELLQAARDSQ